jgi:hypothetical protein
MFLLYDLDLLNALSEFIQKSPPSVNNFFNVIGL